MPNRLLFFIVALSFLNSASAADPVRPNVLLMMVDDMGFSDLGCYGSEIQTPHLDRLASQGIRFTQFYNCAKCETTRATLLSGQYYPEVKNQKLANCVTIAEAMKLGGYRTIMTGKWHLQSDPVSRGFDRYFGHLSGATNFFTGDDTFRVGQEKFDVPKTGFYTTDANVEYAIKYLREKPNSKDPFFLYIAFNAPHYPLQAPKEDVEKYVGKYLSGWDKLRAARFKRQKELGIIDADTRLTERPADVPAWDSLTEDQKRHEDLMMATYAAMIDRVDQNVGKLIHSLEESGELQNTLILFLSDNGACPFQRSKQKSISQKLAPWDPQSYWTYDKGWAHACNTPFREYKQNQHEGGITTPLIAHWPKGISKPLHGTISRQVGHLVDIHATCRDVANVPYPEKFQGKEIGAARGISLSPVLAGRRLQRDEPLFFSFYGKNNAVRDGDWKIVNRNFGKFELYNLASDRTEMDDLSARHPDRFNQMKSGLQNLFADVGQAIPKRSPGKNRQKKKKSRAKSSKGKSPKK